MAIYDRKRGCGSSSRAPVKHRSLDWVDKFHPFLNSNVIPETHTYQAQNLQRWVPFTCFWRVHNRSHVAEHRLRYRSVGAFAESRSRIIQGPTFVCLTTSDDTACQDMARYQRTEANHLPCHSQKQQEKFLLDMNASAPSYAHK